MANINSFDALSDPTRRQLCELLRQGPRTVGQLADALPVTQPAVSQHLKVLKQARMVHVRKDGARRIYSLDPRGIAELRSYVDGLWEDVLNAFKTAAEEQAKEERDE
jgi:DNA-binding transcriptional ArsR family regulator